MIESHYVQENLKQAVLSALAALEKHAGRLGPEDTAPIDEFHIRGREATQELAAQLGLEPKHQVLDVGCGLGGPSRHLAHHFGCHVTGIDLTAAYCEIAQLIADRLGMASLLTYLHGNALEMPFPDSAFDVAWTQHTSMNISDKSRFYAEISRVLKPGGLLAMYDVLAGDVPLPHYPLPWARDPSMSFLISLEALQELLQKAGFEIVSCRDTSAAGRQWFRDMAARQERQETGKPALGLHVVMGPDIRVMSKNVMKNLDEKRISLIELIAKVK